MKFSISKIDITPSSREYFSGYGREFKNSDVQDELCASLIIISKENYNLFIFSLDLLNVEKKFSDQLTFEVNKRIPNKHNIVIISAIHTHSGPAVFQLPTTKKRINEELSRVLFNNLIELLDKSLNNLNDFDSIILERGSINEIYGNRNDKKEYADKSFLVLKFKRKNSLLGSLVSIACHPTILKADNNLFSADIFGVIRKELEQMWCSPVLMLNGACGDVSSRFYSLDSSIAELKRVGKDIANQITKFTKQSEISLNLIADSYYEKNISYNAKSDLFWNERYDNLKKNMYSDLDRILLEHLDNKFEKIDPVTSLRSKQLIFEDFLIVTFSGELDAQFAKNIYERCKNPVLIICYEHDYISYLVDEKKYGKYFESYLSRLPKGEADIFVNKIIEDLNR